MFVIALIKTSQQSQPENIKIKGRARQIDIQTLQCKYTRCGIDSAEPDMILCLNRLC
jgi:hypothetical protein